MFDILSDVWRHPGQLNSPVIPLSIDELNVENVEERISSLHKFGVFSFLIYTKKTELPDEALIRKLFECAAKRYILIFVDEKLICAEAGYTDESLCEFNPMLTRKRLVLRFDGDADSAEDETVKHFILRYENGKFSDVVSELPNEIPENTEYKTARAVQTYFDGSMDLLLSECTSILTMGAYESFIEKYKDNFTSSFAGIFTDRLSGFADGEIYWTYDMLESFYSLGGSDKLLVSLLTDADKRSKKDAQRIYNKTLSLCLDVSYVKPVSDFCVTKSVAFMGNVPYRFAVRCAHRFSIPVWSRENFRGVCENEDDIISGVKYLSDATHMEGGTGGAYTVEADDSTALSRELLLAFAAGAAFVILPCEFSSVEYMKAMGHTPETMKAFCRSACRMLSLGVSVKEGGNCAVMCEDEMIPFVPASKLRATGAEFNFLGVPQAMERASTHHGELLVDKYRYSTMLVDPRVRMEPFEIMKLFEFATHDGNLYRGGTFGDYAKKHLPLSQFKNHETDGVQIKKLYKSGCEFNVFVNTGMDYVKIGIPEDSWCFNPYTGKITKAYSGKVKLSPLSAAVFVFSKENLPETSHTIEDITEIYSLKLGENKILAREDGLKYTLSFDSISGRYFAVKIGEKHSIRVVCHPYTVDITEFITLGENSISIDSDGEVRGCTVKITKERNS